MSDDFDVPDGWERCPNRESAVRPIVLEHENGGRVWLYSEFYDIGYFIEDHAGNRYTKQAQLDEDGDAYGEGWDDWEEALRVVAENEVPPWTDRETIVTDEPRRTDRSFEEQMEIFAESMREPMHIFERDDGSKYASTREPEDCEGDLVKTVTPDG